MAGSRDLPLRVTPSGVGLVVRLTPNAAADEVAGLEAADGRMLLKARVRAVPEKGRANAALVKLIAKWLGVPRSTVRCAAGARSRVKTLEITGDGAALTAAIQARLLQSD